MTDEIKNPDRNEIQRAIRDWNIVEPYMDYHQGELEQLRASITQLQYAMTTLLTHLAENNIIDWEKYCNEV